MLKKPFVINIITALVLVAAGLYSYLSNESRPATALIGPGLGVLLLLATPWMKKEHPVVAHIVVLLTLVFAIVSIYMAIKSTSVTDPAVMQRRILVFSVMAAACLWATLMYVLGFIEKKKARRAAGQA
ncbi:MAG: hypothetical protein KF690_08880 [Bacteroidetes bacterium]|nr:hypothetical protein [Bacteroidota bacterium]